MSQRLMSHDFSLHATTTTLHKSQLKISVAVVAERRTAGIRMRVLSPSIFPVKSYLHTSPTSGRVMAFSLYPSVCSSTTIEMNGTSEGTHTPLL